MLVSRFGARPVVIVGGILVTTGVIAMACVNSLALTYLTFGLIAGNYDDRQGQSTTLIISDGQL